VRKLPQRLKGTWPLSMSSRPCPALEESRDGHPRLDWLRVKKTPGPEPKLGEEQIVRLRAIVTERTRSSCSSISPCGPIPSGRSPPRLVCHGRCSSTCKCNHRANVVPRAQARARLCTFLHDSSVTVGHESSGGRPSSRHEFGERWLLVVVDNGKRATKGEGEGDNSDPGCPVREEGRRAERS
jgi:hypothetical protein